MPSTRPVPFPTFRRPGRWLAVLLLAGPTAAIAQTSPAASTIVAFSNSQPSSAPVRGPDGALYGTTSTSTTITGGLIYRAELDGRSVVTLHQLTVSEGYSPIGGHRFQAFSSTNQAGNAVNDEGASPESELIEGDADGFLYGTTRVGGTHGNGVIFKISKEGTGFEVIHTFAPITSAAGEFPLRNEEGLGSVSPLVEVVEVNDETGIVDRYLYGTAADGGPHGNGTVFRLRHDGSEFTEFTVLHAFTALAADEGSTLLTNDDGAAPLAGLTAVTVEGEARPRLYGVTNLGGDFGNGTLYRLNSVGGGVEAVHHFDGEKGARPLGELLLAESGGSGGEVTLYGTTASGGTNAAGTVTTAGTIYSFGLGETGFKSLLSLDGTHGSTPTGRLIELNGSTFVGAALGGGRCGQGTLFQFSLNGDTVNGNTNCGRRDSGSGSTAPGLLLLLGALGLIRRQRRA
jgi:uncharacterized repeat protein (TIGR03803 family)